MSNDEVLEIAKQSGFVVDEFNYLRAGVYGAGINGCGITDVTDQLMMFAAAIREATFKQCAVECEKQIFNSDRAWRSAARAIQDNILALIPNHQSKEE